MRGDFDLDPNLLYFNSANQSIAPRAVREALFRYHAEYERNPTRGLSEVWARLWEVQGRLAGFLGADRQDLFLRANVTSVLNTFLLGTPLSAGSEILAGELEYGAIVNICRLRARRDGLSLRILKMPATLPATKRLRTGDLVEWVVSQLGPRTRMCLLSHVLGGIGLVMPIAEIARETRGRGIFLVVDGAYAPGAVPVDLTALGDVDFYGCSLYKWMLGPKGTAFGWVARRNQELLRPIQAGWTTYGSFGPFSAFGAGSRFQESFLMSGCHDFAPFRAIAETLDFWQAHGPPALMSRMRELGVELERAIIARLGWRRIAPDDPSTCGPLLAFRVPDRLQAQGPRLMARAHDELGIQINTALLRGQWLMIFSPHVYNTENEIEEMVERLGTLH